MSGIPTNVASGPSVKPAFKLVKQPTVPKRKAIGFTLVELLVVIGIIALLVGILLPALNHAREQANLIKCQANLRSIGQSIAIYEDAYRGVLPEGYYNGHTNTVTGGNIFGANLMNNGTDWTLLLESTMTPGAPSTFGALSGANFTANLAFSPLRQVFICPSAPENSGKTTNPNVLITHYACNPRLMPEITYDNYFAFTAGGLTAAARSYNAGQIKRAAEVILVADTSVAPLYEGNASAQTVATSGGGWTVNGSAGPPDGPATGFNWDRDANGIGNHGGGFAPWQTDCYGLADTGASPVPPGNPSVGPDDPVDMQAWLSGGGGGQAGTTPDQYCNQDAPQNQANFRFRHMGNTALNALFVDGHVEEFTFNLNVFVNWIDNSPGAPIPNYTNLLRKNLYVNPLPAP